MPILLEDLSALKHYIDEFPQLPIFYRRNDSLFEVSAGKVAWEGESDDELEGWLLEKGAKKIRGWVELADLFA